MATYNFTVIETDFDYYNGGTGLAGDPASLTITDSDGQLHATAGSDPGGDQTFSFAGELAVTSYDVTYLDKAQINSSGPEYELFALQVSFSDGSTKYYVMTKDLGFAPVNGDVLSITTFSTFTNTPYGEIESAVCFAKGPQISTVSGMRPIETLRKGDFIQTVDNGCKPILWVGSRLLGEHTLQACPNLRPILIEPSLLDGGDRPILVSPQRRMLLKLDKKGGSERLIRAISRRISILRKRGPPYAKKMTDPKARLQFRGTHSVDR